MSLIHRAAARKRLPNRRPAETSSYEHRGSGFQVTSGHYPDGTVGEIFLNHDRGDSALDVLAHDAAICISLALQHGVSLDDLRHALKRDSRGEAASPIGAALDLVASMEATP